MSSKVTIKYVISTDTRRNSKILHQLLGSILQFDAFTAS
jgi:hypothetical protein